ncbi:hypothetical protein [Leclercia sp.]|uniref:hypothetical protein n=1 Tax=Leclercia sp. TaxID=1898428 RepID=UPI0028BF000D|nr:hypothetical protein [Leclercia sp.]
MKITPEAVKERIAALASAGELSLKEQFYLEALRLLVAGMGSDPVSWTSSDALADVYCGETSMMGPVDTVGDIPLYRHAQPVPVACNHLFSAITRADVLECVSCGRLKSDILSEEYTARSAAMLQAVNSPVIPDGYVMVPKEPDLEMVKAGAYAASNGMLIPGIYRAMLAAAPQLPGNEPSTAPSSCTWHCEEEINNWHADCGYQFQFMEDGPEENGVNFCPKCGKSVAISETE